MPINIIYAYPLYLGGYDVAAMLGGNADQQIVLCNDLETAAKMVSTEPVPVGGMSAKDKIRELVLYSISEEYFTIRQHLGLNIG